MENKNEKIQPTFCPLIKADCKKETCMWYLIKDENCAILDLAQSTNLLRISANECSNFLSK